MATANVTHSATADYRKAVPDITKNILRKIDTAAAGLEIAVTLLLLAVIVAVVFLQVVCRYVLQDPLSWTEELARDALIWMTFIGSALAVRAKAHFALELTTSKLPESMRLPWEILLTGIVAVFLVVLLYQSIRILPVVHYQRSPTLSLPISYLYLSIPVGTALMLVHIATTLATKIAEVRTRPAG